MSARSKDESLHYLLKLACSCQVRGGYTLDEAVFLHRLRTQLAATETETVAAPPCACEADVLALQNLILQAQANGKLSLEEAWTAFNAITLLSKSTDGNGNGNGDGDGDGKLAS